MFKFQANETCKMNEIEGRNDLIYKQFEMFKPMNACTLQ